MYDQITMPEVMPVYYMRSSTGRKIAMSSLRPRYRLKGDNDKHYLTVLQNSARHRRIELQDFRGNADSYSWDLASFSLFVVYPPHESLFVRLKRWFSRR